MVQTTKGGVAPIPEKADKATQANDKAAMDKMAESPKRSEPSDVKAKTPKTTGDWATDHPEGPASPSDAFNSGS
jgi:hypothetical protein